MRFSRIIPLLFLLAVPAIAAPKKIEIPKAAWTRIFFWGINDLTQKARWTPLREVNVPDGSLEVRVWIGFGTEPLQGIRLCRDGDNWKGFYATDKYPYPFAVRKVTPRRTEEWATLWKKVENLGILTLPDSSTLPDEHSVMDGVSYVVEINDGSRYRTYKYGNPGLQKWPEAKKIIAIADVLRDELMPPPRLPFAWCWRHWRYFR